jgi:hypothetical protein
MDNARLEDDGSYMLGLAIVGCALSVFWFGVGFALGAWLL